MNSVNVVGRLTADPELKTTNTGKSVTKFTVAVRSRSSEKDADFFDCTTWGQPAEFLANYGKKGRIVSVSGRLETRSWEAQDGSKRKATEIVANEVNLLDKAPENSGDGSAARAESKKSDNYDPFANE